MASDPLSSRALGGHRILDQRLAERPDRAGNAMALGDHLVEGGLDPSRRQLPILDQGIANLLDDLRDRGLQDDVVVVVWGEFGRTPKINGSKGRDHWPSVMSALVAGGGLKMGQAIGTSSARGETPKDRPYKVPNVLATLYKALGIDPAMTFPSGSGRPMYVLDDRELVTELV